MKAQVVRYLLGVRCSLSAVKSRAAGMSWLTQLIQSFIVVHSLLVQNHCQLINAMFSFFNPLPHFLSLFHCSLFPRGNQCFICCQILCCFLEIYFWNVRDKKKRKKEICSTLKQQLIQISKTHHHFHCTHTITAMCGLYGGVMLSSSTGNWIH